MIKLLLPFVVFVILMTTFSAYSQEMDEMKAVSEELKTAPKDESLWQQVNANPSLENLSEYLAAFPNGKHSKDAKSKFQALQEKQRARVREDKALDAYRKERIVNGLVLELDSKFSELKPYVRSMLNSCGYTLARPHRFAKRVYPTLGFKGQLYTGKSDLDHTVKLDLSLVLKTRNREIKVRQKMRSYRTSEVDSHQALIAAFEDIGAQMKSSGFCPRS